MPRRTIQVTARYVAEASCRSGLFLLIVGKPRKRTYWYSHVKMQVETSWNMMPPTMMAVAVSVDCFLPKAWPAKAPPTPCTTRDIISTVRKMIRYSFGLSGEV